MVEEVIRNLIIVIGVMVLTYILMRIASYAWHIGKWEHFKRVWKMTDEQTKGVENGNEE